MEKGSHDKGDIGLTKTIADLVSKGYKIFLPLSAHLVTDLVVMNGSGMLRKIQVKYCKDRNHGRIQVKLHKTTKTFTEMRTTTYDRSKFDAFAVYSVRTDKVYYISNCEIKSSAKQMFSFRCTESKCRQKVRYASEFEDPENMFK